MRKATSAISDAETEIYLREEISAETCSAIDEELQVAYTELAKAIAINRELFPERFANPG